MLSIVWYKLVYPENYWEISFNIVLWEHVNKKEKKWQGLQWISDAGGLAAPQRIKKLVNTSKDN